jgi:hypothetical protein
MSVGPLVTTLSGSPQPDQRRDRRYPLHLKIEYQLPKAGTIRWSGSGRTLNISSHGVLFESDGLVPDRGEITLELDWPCLLDGVHHLKIVIHGRIVRRAGSKTAVRFTTYDFRTKRSRTALSRRAR